MESENGDLWAQERCCGSHVPCSEDVLAACGTGFVPIHKNHPQRAPAVPRTLPGDAEQTTGQEGPQGKNKE